MHIKRTTFRNRQAWELDNDALRLVILAGGGHLASLTLTEGPRLNPLWVTPWPTREPWDYRPAKGDGPEMRLLAGIAGHNPCLGWFGGPSATEASLGLGVYGEAPVVRWRAVTRAVTRAGVRLVTACDLPAAQMRLTRTITARRARRGTTRRPRGATATAASSSRSR